MSPAVSIELKMDKETKSLLDRIPGQPKERRERVVRNVRDKYQDPSRRYE